jgi:CheY-like chemotaxis protein
MPNSRGGGQNSKDSLRRQIESIKRERMKDDKVVSLREFREVQPKKVNHRILAVDDDEVMRSAMKRVLEAEGYEVIAVEDGLELSKILENSSFDLILLDINLPWVDGYELCTLLKKHPSLRHVPLIMVSGNKDEESIERGFSVGCDNYITKPFEVDHISEVIRDTLLKSS